MYNNPEITAWMDETRSGIFLSRSLDHLGTSLVLGPYITSVVPYYVSIAPLIFIFVPL